MITSMSNPQMKKVQQLLKKAKTRREEGLFAAEGIKMFGEAPSDRIRKVYAAASFAEKEEFQRILEEKGLDSHSDKVEIVDDKVFKNLSDTVTPQGVLCLISMKNWSLSKMLEDADKPLFMILEDLQDREIWEPLSAPGKGQVLPA